MCQLNAKELGYTLKDQKGNIIASGDLTGKNGKVKLAIETKEVEEETTYNYTLEIEYVETNHDQNHNNKAVLNSNVIVELTEEASKTTFNQLASLNKSLESKGKLGEDGFTDVETGVSKNQVYEAEDNDGISYYYRGDVQDNYVKFGKTGLTEDGEDIWWRIIRINGDGSIRMIYAGTSNDEVPDQYSSVTNAVSSIKFSNSFNDNMYVGFEYAQGVRNGNIHNYGNNESATKSIVLRNLNTWFTDNLLDEFNVGVDTLIDINAGFCGDRGTYSSTTSDSRNDNLGINKELTYYGAYIRNYPNGSSAGKFNPAYPSYKCEDQSNDLYTYLESNKGTQSLEYPIGLISGDEVVYAGGLGGYANKSYYLYNETFYWTISPCFFAGNYADVFRIDNNGAMGGAGTDNAFNIRPVINLAPGSLISGDGTASNPYRTV